jgi:hypothetical protein
VEGKIRSSSLEQNDENMVTKIFHRPLRLGIVCIMIAIVALQLLMFGGSSHHAQSARLVIGPNPASPGETITVSGFGYAAAKNVKVYFQDHSNGVVHTVTNAAGGFSVPLMLPRAYVNGLSYVYVEGENGTTKTQVNFIQPSLSSIPSSTGAYPNASSPSSVSYHGSGFIANEQVSFTFNAATETAKTGTLQTDSRGQFTLPLTLPDAPLGSLARLTVADVLHQQVSVAVHLHPRITLRPRSGTAGTQVQVTGTGFRQSEIVTLSFQGKVVQKIRTNARGKFTTTFIVPFSATISPSHNDVVAIGQNSKARASASFQVLPSLHLNTTFGRPGTVVHASGSQFSPRGRVKILLLDPNQSRSSVGILLATTRTFARGAISANFRIPDQLARGQVYIIIAIDTQTGLSSSVPFFVG